MRRWASLALLSIVVPVGLLATFRLTGVLQEPPTPEIITAETVYWNMNRPSDDVDVEEKMVNSYTDDVAFINLEVFVEEYRETSGTFDYTDVLLFQMNATANMSQGYIHSVAVKFSQTDVDAMFIVDKSSYFVRLHNLRMRVFREMSTSEQEAYVEATAVDHPKNSSLKTTMNIWMFTDEENINHRMTITLEVTYFDETAWKKVRIPIELGVLIG